MPVPLLPPCVLGATALLLSRLDTMTNIGLARVEVNDGMLETARTFEHQFVTAQPNAHVRFRRAIERRALWMAEDAARELPDLSLEDALQLVHLYFERGSPKAEPAARRWLMRHLTRARPDVF